MMVLTTMLAHPAMQRVGAGRSCVQPVIGTCLFKALLHTCCQVSIYSLTRTTHIWYMLGQVTVQDPSCPDAWVCEIDSATVQCKPDWRS